MGRVKFLLAATMLLVLTIGPATSASSALRACAAWQGASGGCPRPQSAAGIGNGGVDVNAGWESESPGGGGAGSYGGGGDGGGDGYSGGGGGGTGLPDGVSFIPGVNPYDGEDAASGPGLPPRRGPVVVPPAPGEPVPVCQPQTPCDPALVVRVTDLVSIDAQVSSQRMEPDGWVVVGLPANFMATAVEHTRSGMLLGFPADVRFTPAGFHWDYGDGTSVTTETGGASWAELGLPEFSETPTSHVFTEVGNPTITLDVLYTAEYRFAGSDWREVEGVLAVPGAPITAHASLAGTVLVAEGCSSNPGGPGC